MTKTTWAPRDRTPLFRKYLQLLVSVAVLGVGCLLTTDRFDFDRLFAQEPTANDSADVNANANGAAAQPVAATATGGGANNPGDRSTWQVLKTSGVIGLLIGILSVVSTAFVIDHFLTIRRERIMPSEAVSTLEAQIKDGKIEEAIQYCEDPAHASLLTEVVLAGLTRFRNSEFGFAEYRAAVEEEGEGQTAKLYRRTEVLSVIGAIAPMLGLLGTVQGMIQAFNTIAASGGSAKPADLADAISLALVTTLLGLMVAIPTLIFLSFFRTRIDSLVAEAGKSVETLLLPLGRQRHE